MTWRQKIEVMHLQAEESHRRPATPQMVEGGPRTEASFAAGRNRLGRTLISDHSLHSVRGQTSVCGAPSQRCSGSGDSDLAALSPPWVPVNAAKHLGRAARVGRGWGAAHTPWPV